MATILTDALIKAFDRTQMQTHQRNVQGSISVPVNVDLTAGPMTLGRALLEAVNARPLLAAEFLITIAGAGQMTLQDEKFFLSNIEYCAIIPPTDVLYSAYDTTSVDVATIPGGEGTYKPVCGWYRSIVSGPANVIVEVGYSV